MRASTWAVVFVTAITMQALTWQLLSGWPAFVNGLICGFATGWSFAELRHAFKHRRRR